MMIAIFLLRYAFLILFLIVLGALSLLGLNALLKPRWLSAIAAKLHFWSLSILPLTLTFILVLFYRNSLFPWVTTAPEAHSFAGFYYQELFFSLRGVLYILLAGWMIWLVQAAKNVSGALCLVLILFFGSFASYDWVMSQSSGFHSTIFGLLMIVNGSLIVHALCLSQTEITDENLLIDLNQIHLALIALWSYLALMQFLTVWSGNLPNEVIYFKDRFQGLYGTLAVICLAGQALIPIPLLLFRKLKKSRTFTRNLGFYTVLIQSLHLWWLTGGLK